MSMRLRPGFVATVVLLLIRAGRADDLAWHLPEAYDYAANWNLEMLNVRHVWAKGWSPGIVVAVVDTGVDYDHPDLAANMWQKTIDGNPAHGWDIIQDVGDPKGDLKSGHGTHIAGIIAASGKKAGSTVGVNYTARIMAVKALDGEEIANEVQAIRIARGIGWAVEHDADVINCSVGFDINRVTDGDENRRSRILAAFEKVIEDARKKGIIIVAAAGNAEVKGRGGNIDRDEGGRPFFYPAAFAKKAGDEDPKGPGFDNVISVAAIDSRGEPLLEGNRGFQSVNIAAPGRDILSTWPGGGYKEESGTSQAAAHVSGAISLMLARGGGRKAGQGGDVTKRLIDHSFSSTRLTQLDCGGRQLDLSFLADLPILKPTLKPPQKILLKPHWADEIWTMDRGRMGAGVPEEMAKKMGAWRKWLVDGSVAGTKGDIVLLYTLDNDDGAFHDRYAPFDARLVFRHALPIGKGKVNAQLADGVAFLWHRDQGTTEPVFRQAQFFVCKHNGDRDPPALDNALKNLTIDTGDSLWIVVKLAWKAGEAIPIDRDRFAADLQVEPAGIKRPCGDLQWYPSLRDAAGIPAEGKNRIIVAKVGEVLHIRIFDGLCRRVVDTDEAELSARHREDEAKLMALNRKLEALKKILEGLRSRSDLTDDETDEVIKYANSIVDEH